MTKQLTVFTPSFNRAYLLPNLYNSLVRQTSKDFAWLIVDDGSSDGTEELVQKWIDENKVEILYKYQDNLGMHGAHNTAYELIETELNVCIDSDDYMPDNAVELILDTWSKNKDDKYAGILGLDCYKNGQVVSSRKFPEELKSGKYFELKSRFGLKGDIKFVYRTDVIKKYPAYPIFKEEKFVPLNYKYLLIDQDYDMLFLNEFLCVVEYMEDGSSRNIIKQYLKNPKGFEHERKVRMKYAYSLKERFRNAIHYVSCSIQLKNGRFLSDSTNVLLTILAIPLGIALNVYIRTTNRKGWM
ncbi:glycosyltransferase family 2 protein [Carboxylicivirga sp. RSCT41]|uniref:glycosyltransferase family 2 protein n=1 Tax=Carboxylicivirga agarovorans TaxID=3417570 RepID=UPI003D338738